MNTYVALLPTIALSAPPRKIFSFDEAWRFKLGDSDSYSLPSTDDSTWRLLDVPHDWSSEDLPPRSDDLPPLVWEVRNGTWLFKRGGQNSSWADIDLDEKGWTPTLVPSDWRVANNYTEVNAYGWYRRHVDATAAQVSANGTLVLALGAVAKRDETYLNGVLVGRTGGFTPDCTDYLRFRSYKIPAGLLQPKDNVVAVKVFSEGKTPDGQEWPGGLYDHPVLRNGDQRTGAFDAAISQGQRATGYAVGGIGWYRRHFATPREMAPGDVATLTFDGVYMHSDVWLNGAHVRSQPVSSSQPPWTLSRCDP